MERVGGCAKVSLGHALEGHPGMRAHADAPGITWSVFPGPGGTMIIVEHAEDRCTLNRAEASARRAAAPASPAAGAGVDRASA